MEDVIEFFKQIDVLIDKYRISSYKVIGEKVVFFFDKPGSSIEKSIEDVLQGHVKFDNFEKSVNKSYAEYEKFVRDFENSFL